MFSAKRLGSRHVWHDDIWGVRCLMRALWVTLYLVWSACVVRCLAWIRLGCAPLSRAEPCKAAFSGADLDVDKTCLCATAKVLPFSGWFIEWMAASTDRFWWRVCSPQHHARGSFWSDHADRHQPDEKGSAPAMPERGDAKPEWGFQCHHDLQYVAQPGICWCWSGGAISTSGCSPL